MRTTNRLKTREEFTGTSIFRANGLLSLGYTLLTFEFIPVGLRNLIAFLVLVQGVNYSNCGLNFCEMQIYFIAAFKRIPRNKSTDFLIHDFFTISGVTISPDDVSYSLVVCSADNRPCHDDLLLHPHYQSRH